MQQHILGRTCQCQIKCSAQTNNALQSDGATVNERNPKPSAKHTKRGRLLDNPKVAKQRKLQTALKKKK